MVTDSSGDIVSNGGDGVNSPHSRRRSLPSPWASVVRGDSEQNFSSPSAAAASLGAPGSSSSSPPIEQASATDDNTVIGSSGGSEPQLESSDFNGDANAGPPRRAAWNRPLNGVSEPTASVMGGAASWPALSELARPALRSPSDVPRPVSDGSAASSQAPIISQPPLQRPVNNNTHSHSTGNNPMAGRQRSRNRGGGGGSSSGSASSQNTFNQPSFPMPPPFPVPYGMMPAVLDNSVRGARPIGGVGASQSHPGNDHPSQRNNSRRGGGFGPRPRGDRGGLRDQDRRDVHPPPPYVPPPMGYMPPPLPPPGAAPYMAPPPMGVFPGQMGFDMTSAFFYVPPMPPEPFRAVPMVRPLPMIYPPANENPLTSMIVKQIDFYFSDDNLVKDSFLRSKMDDNGWVPIPLIASFRRVQQLTNDLTVISEALRCSTVVEVQDDKVRRRDEWSKWLLSSGSGSGNSASGSRTPGSAPDHVFASSSQEVSLEDQIANANGKVDAKEGYMEMTAAGHLPEESADQSGLANGDDTAI